jgi:hypothetical protein
LAEASPFILPAQIPSGYPTLHQESQTSRPAQKVQWARPGCRGEPAVVFFRWMLSIVRLSPQLREDPPVQPWACIHYTAWGSCCQVRHSEPGCSASRSHDLDRRERDRERVYEHALQRMIQMNVRKQLRVDPQLLDMCKLGRPPAGKTGIVQLSVSFLHQGEGSTSMTAPSPPANEAARKGGIRPSSIAKSFGNL